MGHVEDGSQNAGNFLGLGDAGDKVLTAASSFGTQKCCIQVTIHPE